MGHRETLVEYIIQDMGHMTNKEIGKVYKYIRTHIIAEIPVGKIKIIGDDGKECFVDEEEVK